MFSVSFSKCSLVSATRRSSAEPPSDLVDSNVSRASWWIVFVNR